MKKTLIIGTILITISSTLISCNKSYNFNGYTESEVIQAKIDSNGKITKPLYSIIKDGSKIEYDGVVNFYDYGYDADGNKIYFYRIQPIYKGYNVEYASSTSNGLLVLSPLEEVNRNIDYKFYDYLKEGDVVKVKGKMVKDGKYYTCEDNKGEEAFRMDYIQLEEVEIISNLD